MELQRMLTQTSDAVSYQTTGFGSGADDRAGDAAARAAVALPAGGAVGHATEGSWSSQVRRYLSTNPEMIWAPSHARSR
jgi:hypothetical protein